MVLTQGYVYGWSLGRGPGSAGRRKGKRAKDGCRLRVGLRKIFSLL